MDVEDDRKGELTNWTRVLRIMREEMASGLARAAELQKAMMRPTIPATELRVYDASPMPKRPKRRGGRPRIPEAELLGLIHLRDHCSPKWSLTDLASHFIDPDIGYGDPKNAIRQRLTRARRRFKDRDCPLCASDCWPHPPSQDLRQNPRA